MGFIVLTIQESFSSPLVTIGHDNHAETALITASSTTAGFDPSFVGLWTMHDAWRAFGSLTEALVFDIGAAGFADYLGVFGHNMSTIGATYYFEYASSLAGPWTSVVSDDPSSDNVIFERFPSTSSRFWRLRFSGGSAPPTVAVVAFGVALELERGMAPGFQPPIVDNFKIKNSETDKSLYIGRSLEKEPQSIPFAADLLSADFVRQHWAPFLEHAQANPFFFSWNDEEYPNEAVFAWTTQTDFPEYQDVVNMRVRMRLRALRNLD